MINNEEEFNKWRAEELKTEGFYDEYSAWEAAAALHNKELDKAIEALRKIMLIVDNDDESISRQRQLALVWNTAYKALVVLKELKD